MKPSQKGALIGLTAFTIYSAGVFGAGYAVGKLSSQQTPIEPEVSCYEMVTPLRTQFKAECEKKTDETLYNGTLADIIHQRDEMCISDEVWKCRPTQPTYLPETQFEAKFTYQ